MNTRMRSISENALFVFHTTSGEIVRAVWGTRPQALAHRSCELRGAVVDVSGGLPWHL